MRKTLLLAAFGLSLSAAASAQPLVITGIFDGPLTGGTPKVLELKAVVAIPDLSIYDLQNYNNGGTTATNTVALTGSAAAGQFIYVTSDAGATFQTYFGFPATITNVAALNVNGDDAVALRRNGTIIDVVGEIGVDGTGTAWEYLDGWAYSSSRATGSATFNAANWTYSGINATDACTTNATCGSTFPVGTSTTLPVELVSLTAQASGSDAIVRWTTASETNNASFAVEALRGSNWSEVATAAGRGTTSERADYQTRVSGLGSGRHTLRLVQRDLDGTATVAGTVELVIGQTAAFDVAVRGNATASPEVSFVSRESGATVVAVSDVTGRTVARYAVEATAGARMGLVVADLAAGVYIVRVEGARGSSATTLVVR